jgi:hypothetical protein
VSQNPRIEPLPDPRFDGIERLAMDEVALSSSGPLARGLRDLRLDLGLLDAGGKPEEPRGRVVIGRRREYEYRNLDGRMDIESETSAELTISD